MSNRPTKETERNQEATVYVGNLDERVTEELLYELMVQAGPVLNVHLPKDRVNQVHQGYGFAEFRTEKDAEYASLIMNQIRLFGKPLRVNKASLDKQRGLDVGADLFIGNLDSMVDEKLLYDTFSVFGPLISAPRIARDESGNSKGYGFVIFDNFESSDQAIESMNNQYLMNKPCVVNYAFKRDGKGERHGDEAERLLAAEARKHNYTLPIQPPPASIASSGFGDSGRGSTPTTSAVAPVGYSNINSSLGSVPPIPTGPRSMYSGPGSGFDSPTGYGYNRPSAPPGFS